MGYGLRPARSGGGAGSGYNTGGFSEYAIDVAGTSTGAGVIYAGDFVMQATGGVIQRQANDATGETPTTSARTTGVAIGFRWVRPSGQPHWSQYYDGNANNTEAYAFVADDPNQVYMIQSDGPWTQASMGQNAPVNNFATADGNVISGNSGITLNSAAIATTNTLGLRIVGIPEDGSNEISATPNVLVKLNAGVSTYSNPLGV